MSDSLGLVDFAIGLANSVLNFPNGQVKFFEEFKLHKSCVINPAYQTFLGPVEMNFGLVEASYSLPQWQPLKLTFFAPCTRPYWTWKPLVEGDWYHYCNKYTTKRTIIIIKQQKMTSRLSATLPLFLSDPHPWQLQWLQVQLVPPLYLVCWLDLLATCILH